MKNRAMENTLIKTIARRENITDGELNPISLAPAVGLVIFSTLSYFWLDAPRKVCLPFYLKKINSLV
ncbi:hypothetical protein UFOVP1451_23 [uncultured Caudovirales phage]|uniref:Uncharacterized protein n=1 Tax=uncultured Caudovirales phage TaxID=2100421 RepID=A0A6J5SGZ2_9CAUD|nr:hypothetical protein UFOVP1451_23 [uncultured Caudovirales phage]